MSAATSALLFVATKVSNYKVFTNGGYQEPIVFWNDGGDISASTMASRSYATFLDKEGQTCGLGQYIQYCRGQYWF
jgi:hypothetical protein